MTKPSAAGLVAAGLLSVVIFPAAGLALLRRDQPAAAADAAPPAAANPVLSSDDRLLCRLGGQEAALR